MNVPSSRSSWVSLAVARPLDELSSLDGELDERLALDLADDRDDETALGGDGEPDVRAREDPQLVVGELRVQLSVSQQGDRRELREDVGDGHLLVAQPLAERLRARHVGRHRDLERRRFPGFRQAARDRAADRRQRDDLGLERRGADRGVRRRRGGALDVLGDDPALRARAGEVRELDAALAGDPAGERRRFHAAVDPRRLRFGGRLFLGSGFPAPLALFFARLAGRAFLLLVLLDLDLGLGWRRPRPARR